MEIAVYLLANLFHIYAIYKFSDVFFNKEGVNKPAELIGYLLYFAINSFLFLQFHNFGLNILGNLIPFFAITFLYPSSIPRKAIITISMYAIAMACDAIMMVVSQFVGKASLLFTEGMATALTLFLFALLFKYILRSRKEQQDTRFHLIYVVAIIFVPGSSIVIGQTTMKNFDRTTVLVAVSLMFINFMVFFLYDKLQQMYYEKHKIDMIHQMNEAYANQLKLMYESNNRIRCIKHDINNHIYQMQNLLEENRLEELGQYLNTTKSYVTVENQYVSSGNPDIDSLLNYKLYQAEQNGISFRADIKLPENVHVAAFDMNVILGNLLDNAIEALGRTADKQLEISVTYQKGMIKLEIRNTFDGIVLKRFDTRKENRQEQHGLGLLSVRNMLQKYNGLLDIKYDDNWFTASVMMYEKDEST